MSGHDRPQLYIEDFRDLCSIDPTRFKKSDDFAVEVIPRTGGAGTVLRFVDAKLGIIIAFPWWDSAERDISEWKSGYVPLGTCDEPYFEEDQCWRLLVWQEGDVVYIASGDEDDDALYDTLLSLPVKEYTKAWAELFSTLRSGRHP
jgi:hypothetical protein